MKPSPIHGSGKTIKYSAINTGRRITLPQLLHFIEFSPIGFHIIDSDGRIKHVNDRWLEMLGYTRSEFESLGLDNPKRNIFSHIKDEHVVDAQLSFFEKLEDPTTATSKRTEFRVYTRNDGGDIYVETHDTFLRDIRTGDITVLTSFQDVTERVLAVRRERFAIIGQSTAGIVHSANQHLAATNGFLQLALRHPDEATLGSVRHQLVEALAACHKMGGLIKGLLDLGRLSSDKPTPMRVSEALDRVITMCDEVFGKEAGVKLTRLPATLPLDTTVLISPSGFEGIMLNLLKNAIEACAMQTDKTLPREVTISANLVLPDRINLTVTDTGVGMTKAQMDKLFIGQVATTKGEKGTGLGLWTVKQAVDAANGQIVVSSTLGVGTRFSVTLPTIRRLPPPVTPTLAALDVSIRREDAARVTLWFIDDALDQRVLANAVLKSMGFTPGLFDMAVTALSTLQELIERNAKLPDIIVVDHILCGKDIDGQTFIVEALKILAGRRVFFNLRSGVDFQDLSEGTKELVNSGQIAYSSKDREGEVSFRRNMVTFALKALGLGEI